MKVDLNKLKNIKVYLYGEEEPFGIFSDTILDNFGNIKGCVIKTISIVPISKAVNKEDILDISYEKIILAQGVGVQSINKFIERSGSELIYSNNIKTAITPDAKVKKLKNISFDFETGQICDIVVLKNIISGKEEISVNKIYAKDNTMYVEK